MIEIRDLYKSFNEGRVNEVNSLKGINLQIVKGEFVILIGANGSGKSTLLNSIAGNIYPTRGQIKFEDTEVSRLPEYKRSRWVARVFQNPLMGTAPDLTILENFRLAALRASSRKMSIGIDEKFKNLVKARISVLGMGLENRLDQLMGTLSGGQRQALTLLMCVMDELRILLLDEPTAALDPRSAELVMITADKLIKEYQLTALMVTHNLKDAFQYGNRLIQLEEGIVVRDISEIQKKNLQVADIYNWFI